MKQNLKIILFVCSILLSSFLFVVLGKFYSKNTKMRYDTCGEGLTWDFEESSGTLTISGTGEMTDFSDSTMIGIIKEPAESTLFFPPWEKYFYSITSIIIEPGITSIGSHAFNYCDNLEQISIPDTVTQIGISAFASCASLKNAEIPDSVKHINDNAFFDCLSLTHLKLGKGLMTIGYKAFQRCPELKQIFIPENVECFFGNSFDFTDWENFSISEYNPRFYKIENTIFFVPENSDEKALLRLAPQYQGHYIIPENVSIIDISAFDECYGLTDVTFPVDGVSLLQDRTTIITSYD